MVKSSSRYRVVQWATGHTASRGRAPDDESALAVVSKRVEERHHYRGQTRRPANPS